MNRYDARQLAFELLFASTYFSEETEDGVGLYDKERRLRGFEENEYVRDLLTGVADHRDELDALIAENAKGWRIGRISRTALSILRLSVYEMLYRTDVPYNVSINEAVELAKKYGEDSTSRFVNGILNTIAEKKGLKSAAPPQNAPEAKEQPQ